jgi:hypothetical protein
MQVSRFSGTQVALTADFPIPLGIQGHMLNEVPIAGVARPTCEVALSRLQVHRMTLGQDRPIFADMSLGGADIADASVSVVHVVTMEKLRSPLPCFVQPARYNPLLDISRDHLTSLRWPHHFFA